LALPMSVVMPAVTPVNFGTMYTGAMPSVHGIESYVKPIITIDTFFDALVRAGKKIAFVVLDDSSMAMIFKGRAIDYFVMPTDDAAAEKGLELIAADEYDVVLVYGMGYDDVIHVSTPDSPEALAAFHKHITHFDLLCKQVKNHWQSHNTLICFATDHGNHLNWDGYGTHGEYRPEDINVMHFYGAVPKK